MESSLLEHEKNLENLKGEFESELPKVADFEDLKELKAKYLGGKGPLTQILKSLKDLNNEEKQEIGKKTNELKKDFNEKIAFRTKEIQRESINKSLEKNWIDKSYLRSVQDLGVIGGGHHPISTLMRKIEDLFMGMGFSVLDGPEVEDEYHNFTALNIPEDHPARDMQDTFYFSKKFEDKDGSKIPYLLRSQTSNVQIRGMKKFKPPFKFICPGKVFRAEKVDACHEMIFHQIEGMVVGEDISMANLIYYLKQLIQEIFEEDLKFRIRPGYFPFTEPSIELDMNCLNCKGKGCPVCKYGGWLEGIGAGMIHPEVLRSGGIDPDKYNGFAFGLGLDRMCLLKYGIDDIRHLQSGNINFLKQFKSY